MATGSEALISDFTLPDMLVSPMSLCNFLLADDVLKYMLYCRYTHSYT